MSPARFVLTLLAVVAVLYGAALLLAPDRRRPNFEYVPADMVHSLAAETGALTAAFPDGILARTPPEGTIARGAALDLIGYGPTPEEAFRAGQELENPLPDTPAVRARGSTVFGNVCASCHGASAGGDGAVPKKGFAPPPTFHRPETRALKDGEMWHAITFGRKNMPPLAEIVSVEDRWSVIRYVRSLLEGR